MPRIAKPIAHNFYSHVIVTPSDPDNCWEWQGYKDKDGYGTITSRATGKIITYKAHRLSYELLIGPIPDGMAIDHMCHNEGCVNPEHLRVVTPSQNSQNRRGAQKNNKTGIRGVSYNKQMQKYVAYVSINNKFHYLGTFNDIKEAEETALQARLKLHTHNDMDKMI